MSLSHDVESLAADLGQAVYLEIARWRLFVADAHLDHALAEALNPLVGTQASSAQIDTVLEKITVPLGDGSTLPLARFLSPASRQQILTVLREFTED